MTGRSPLLCSLLLLFVAAGSCVSVAMAGTVVRTFTFSPGDVTVAGDERGYLRYSFEGGAPWGDPGSPEVPGLSVLVDLPAGTRAVALRATAGGFVDLQGGAPVRPAQRPASGLEPPSWTEPMAARYGESEWTSSPPAVLGPAGTMRGRSLASLVLLPVQVIPATGRARLATRIEVTVETAADPQALVRKRIVPEWEVEMDAGFAAVLSRGPEAVRQGIESGRRWSAAPALGPQIGGLGAAAAGPGLTRPFAPTALPSTLGSPVEYLIITNEAMKPVLQTLADWKTEKGVPAAVRTVEFIEQNYPFGVDRAERVRMFVRDAYTQWGTLWVLLAGDTPVIPVRYAHTTFFGGAELATDLYYSDLDRGWNADGDSLFGEGFIDIYTPGDELDLYPDVYVGRAPIENPSQAQIFVDKQLLYAVNPAAGYLCKGLFFAEVLFPQDWQQGQSIASDGATIAEHAISRLSGCIQPTRLYENYTAFPGALPLTKQAVVDSMNAGYNLLHHVGHGYRNSMSCGDAALNNPDVVALHNLPKVSGLLYAINCTSAALDFESISEEFLLASGGGAACVIGSTNYDFPATGDGYQNEFYNLMFQDGFTRIGEAQGLSKVPFIGFSNFDNVQRWTQMTLLMFGDPEMRLWTEEPVALSVSHPASLTLRDTTVTVGVQRGGQPLPNATVCLYKAGEDYRIGTTDGAGQVTLSVHAASTGTVKVTVTALDSRPYRGTLTVTGTAQVALVSRSADRSLADSGGGTVGNGNGVLDAGETVNLTLPVTNLGGAGSGSATATLLSLDSRAVVLVGAGSYGVIPAGGSAAGTQYRISVARSGVLDGDEMHLRLVISDGLGRQYPADHFLVVRAPKVQLLARLLNDGGGGNGDQFLDVGETADYTVTLVNLAEGVARGVTATLTAASAGVAVLDGSSSFGNLGALGQATGDVFRVQNLSQPDPRFTLAVSDFYGPLFTQEVNFTAPAAPANLLPAGSATSITMVWTLSPAADLAGYNIYRANSQGGPFTKRNFVPSGRSAYYSDEGLAALTRYYYYVTAVDSSGNQSAATAVQSASTNPPMHVGFPIPMGRTTPSSPVIGDLERDGQLEVVVGSDVLYAWHANGQGVVDADGSERTSGDFTMQGTYYAGAPAISDLDNDGVMDIVACAWETKLLYVFGPDGSVKPGFPVSLLDAVWSSPAVGDVDGDGFKEIVFASNGARFYAFNHDGTELRDGDSNPGTQGVFFVMGAADNYGSPALADLDHDGKLDIIAGSRDGRIYAWRWNGTAISGFPYGPFGAFTASPAVGDVNNDGKWEIFAPAGDNRLYGVAENGVAVAGFPVLGIPFTGTSRAPSPALVDIDGDGQREILCAGTDGQLRIVRNNGAYYPGWSAVRFTSKTSAATESSPVAADLDGDGHIEILIGSEDAQFYGLRDDGQPLAGFPIRLDGEVRGTPMIWDFDQNGSAEILLAGWDKNMYVWTYPGTYVPNMAREWVMFRHDSERTGRTTTSILVGVEGVAVQSVEPIDGGIRLRWKLPPEALADGGRWLAFRADGGDAGVAAGRLTAVPEGYRAVGGEAVTADPDGWLALDDRTVTPGTVYSYVLARVESAPGTAPLAFGPYPVQAVSDAPGRAYLAAPFPNPGAGSQTIAFGLPEGLAPGAVVRLELYDVRGARVRTLVERSAGPGRFVVTWDGRNGDGRSVAAGVYLYRLTAGRAALGGRLVRLEP